MSVDSDNLRVLGEGVIAYCNDMDAANAKLRSEMERILKQLRVWSWNPEKFKWVEAEGVRGKYQRFPEQDAKIEVSVDYKALLSDLKEHKNFLQRDGFSYWLFPDLATVGRKKAETKR